MVYKVYNFSKKLFKIMLYQIYDFLLRQYYDDDYIIKFRNIKIARKLGVKVGENCRFYSLNLSTEPYLIEIGNHVTITNGVQFITHDGGVWVFRQKEPDIELFGKIEIGNNVFIGLNSIILPATKVGNNSIVAAGSIVKGDYEDNIVIAGVPAKKICTTQEYYERNLKRFHYTKGKKIAEKRDILEKSFFNY